MFKPALEYLFTLRIVAGGDRHDFGPTPVGPRVFAAITGGSFEGPRLKGTVAPSGGDWPIVTAPGNYLLDVRAHLVTDAGAAILMTYTGRWNMTPDVAARAFNPATANDVKPEEQYFRTSIAFQTGAPDLAWLNDLIAVGVGHKTPEGVAYTVFKVT